MTVFTNRIRSAYVRKRSKRCMATVTLLFIAVAMLFSLAAREDEKDLQAVSAEFSSVLRHRVVSSWVDSGIAADRGALLESR